jgi:eukaryotic-like serine/threonine-protein kinase
MALSPGTRIGPYEIVGAIGAGGMGEVYKARDPRLDRIVAIKVLPADHLADGDSSSGSGHSSARSRNERLERFDREARAVAALSHPNICAVFDVGQDARTAYLVMEYLDGETLGERLAAAGRATSSRTGRDGSDAGSSAAIVAAGRPLPIAETLGIAVQLANALAAAHNAGIVHRDLKPSNIILLRTGATQHGAPQVKVLDFGLARIASAAAPALETTIAAPLTGIGMLVGTVPYMSPEQVEGREADARSDIFSLGSVIYEMATGRRAFDAGSQAGVIAAILERQPEPITRVQPMTPPGLDRIVRSCLAKTPDDRWQHATDIARQLGWLASELDSGASAVSALPAPAAGTDGGQRWRSLGWPHAIAGAAVLLLAADLAWRPPGRSGGQQSDTGATAVHMPLGVPGVDVGSVRVSPDGRTLAISGSPADGRSGIWIQRLAEGRAEQISNLDADAVLVGWSRDGTELAVRSPRGLLAIRLEGGLVRTLAPSTSGPIQTWGENDALWGDEDGLRALALGTGAARDLIGGPTLRPRFLPDGRRFLYSTKRPVRHAAPARVASLAGRRDGDVRHFRSDRLIHIRRRRQPGQGHVELRALSRHDGLRRQEQAVQRRDDGFLGDPFDKGRDRRRSRRPASDARGRRGQVVPPGCWPCRTRILRAVEAHARRPRPSRHSFRCRRFLGIRSGDSVLTSRFPSRRSHGSSRWSTCATSGETGAEVKVEGQSLVVTATQLTESETRR